MRGSSAWGQNDRIKVTTHSHYATMMKVATQNMVEKSRINLVKVIPSWWWRYCRRGSEIRFQTLTHQRKAEASRDSNHLISMATMIDRPFISGRGSISRGPSPRGHPCRFNQNSRRKFFPCFWMRPTHMWHSVWRYLTLLLYNFDQVRYM